MPYKTVSQIILEQLLTDLPNIKKVNGYNHDVIDIEDGIDLSVTNYPSIEVALGDKISKQSDESGYPITAEMDVQLILHLNNNSGTERDKFIADVEIFFLNGDFGLVKGKDGISNYEVKTVIRPITVNIAQIEVIFTFGDAIIKY